VSLALLCTAKHTSRPKLVHRRTELFKCDIRLSIRAIRTSSKIRVPRVLGWCRSAVRVPALTEFGGAKTKGRVAKRAASIVGGRKRPVNFRINALLVTLTRVRAEIFGKLVRHAHKGIGVGRCRLLLRDVGPNLRILPVQV
jgi:hypothetical protein